MLRRAAALVVALGLVGGAVTVPAAAPTPKPGGVLRLTQREDLPVGFAIHETATLSTVWPASPCFSNLVSFDPAKPVETFDTIVPELAERWSWQDGYRNIVFFLRRDVRWHDGQPFTSKDVKSTFDMVREAPDARTRLRVNPRKEWYANVEAIEAPEPSTVVFRLKRPQPSILMMLASGQSPVYPAHVPAADMRTRCVGTGPFKLKEWRRGEFVEYVRNPDYFVKGLPYLDGLRYVIINERGTRTAAIQTGQVDASFPGETPKPIADQLRVAAPTLSMTPVSGNGPQNLLVNTTRPPFNDVRVRLAVSHAIDRHGVIRALFGEGGGVVGVDMRPAPWGVWSLAGKDVLRLPGYGKSADEKRKARTLLAEAGFTATNPLRVEMATRSLPTYVDFASFVVSELRRVGVEASLKQMDTVQWYTATSRKEYQLGANVSGFGIDDPDAIFYENFACGSVRNYTGYCSEQVMSLIDRQSQELDPKKRLAMVREIQVKLEDAGARPTMGWRTDYFTQGPAVRNMVPHHGGYNWGRLTNVWLER